MGMVFTLIRDEPIYLMRGITNHAHKTWYEEAPSKGAKSPTWGFGASKKLQWFSNFFQRL